MSNNPETPSPRVFQCPSCGSSLEVVDAPSVTCKYCGNSVPVPAHLRPQKPQVIQPQVIVQQAPDYSQQYAQAVRGGQRFGCIFTLLLLLLIGGITVFALVSSQTAISTVVNEVSNATGIGVQLPGSTPTPSFAEAVLEFGGKGSGPGLFEDARYVAVDPDGNIFVAEFDTGRMQKFDPAGKFLQQIDIEPDKDGYNTVEGLAADYAGHVFVSRRGDILKYDAADGQLMTTFPGKFPDTWYGALAVDPSNALYATHNTASDDDVLKLSPEGKLLKRWKSIVTSVNKKDPALDLYLAVDGTGNIYISSSFSAQIYIFDKDGKFVDRFGEEGSDPGQLNSPGAIAIDGHNRVYVKTFGRVDVFNSSGNYLGSLPQDYTKGAVMGLTVDIQGSIYAITNNGLVIKYRLAPQG